MACRVVSLPERGSKPVVDFLIKSTSEPGGRVWKMLSRKLVECSAQRHSAPLFELFLFFLGNRIRRQPEPAFLADLLDAARRSGFGSRVYLVTPANLRPSRQAHLSWLEVAAKRRAADLLQLEYEPTQPESIDQLWQPADSGDSPVEEAVNRARQRRQLLRRHEMHGRWHCYTRAERSGLHGLLLDRPRFPEPRPCEYLLVVVDEDETQEQEWLIEDVRGDYRDHKQLLVATTAAVEPSLDLVRFCGGADHYRSTAVVQRRPRALVLLSAPPDAEQALAAPAVGARAYRHRPGTKARRRRLGHTTDLTIHQCLGQRCRRRLSTCRTASW